MMCALAPLTLGVALADEAERRELGAHEHGHSVLNIAIEDERIEMELMAPGMDIVGFEHAATSDERKAAVEHAKTVLSEPLDLFVLPAAAGCTTESAAVEVEAEDEHAAHDEEAVSEGGESHTEFHAEYALTCASPAELGGIQFAYFEQFPGAEEIEVTMVTPTGQTSYEVKRAAPRIDLEHLF